jgi:hypothetical protein
LRLAPLPEKPLAVLGLEPVRVLVVALALLQAQVLLLVPLLALRLKFAIQVRKIVIMSGVKLEITVLYGWKS